MKKTLNFSQKERLQLVLAIIAILVVTMMFIPVPIVVTYCIELTLFILAATAALELRGLKLQKYATFFAIAAFLYSPIFILSGREYIWVRPNFFVVIVSIFLCILLQEYKNHKLKKRG